VQSVDRAAAILEILARDGEAGVTEVARELDVHKSTASRLLAALDRRELVTQDAARGKFRLGAGLVRLAAAASHKLDVVQESRPVCRALAQDLGETVNLAILSGRDALYLDQVAGPAARFRHRGGRTRGRADGRRGAGPQRRGKRDRLDQRLGPELPHPGRTHQGDRGAGPPRRRRGLPPPRLALPLSRRRIQRFSVTFGRYHSQN
jgi:DNA-binding transcriptional ArsR family regulator